MRQRGAEVRAPEKSAAEVCRVFEVYEDEQAIFLVMEKCQGEDLSGLCSAITVAGCTRVADRKSCLLTKFEHSVRLL